MATKSKKELELENESLKNEINELTTKVDALQDKIESLTKKTAFDILKWFKKKL